MKNSVILDIFNGDKGHRETMLRTNVNNKNIDILDETFKELKEKLSPEMFKIFEKFIDAQDLELLDEIDFYFVEGFKLGLRIGIECIQD